MNHRTLLVLWGPLRLPQPAFLFLIPAAGILGVLGGSQSISDILAAGAAVWLMTRNRDERGGHAR